MTLAWVYGHHREELIAALMTEYRYELEEEDEVSSSTLGRLWIYYNQLPTMNRVQRAILEIEPSTYVWDGRDALIADLVDAQNFTSYILQQVNTKQKVKPPKPYPRPDYGRKLRQKQDPTPKRNRLPGQVIFVPKKEV